MPHKNKKACQAKAQHIQGGKFFKEGNGGWAVNIAEEEIPSLSSVSISGDEDSEDDNDDFFAVGNGIKRKAAIDNEQSTKDSSDEKGYKEVAAHKIVSKAEAFWKDKFSKVSHHK